MKQSLFTLEHTQMKTDHKNQVQQRIGTSGNHQKQQRPLGISHRTQNRCPIIIEHKKRHPQKINPHVKG